jgi:hypothetical protein
MMMTTIVVSIVELLAPAVVVLVLVVVVVGIGAESQAVIMRMLPVVVVVLVVVVRVRGLVFVSVPSYSCLVSLWRPTIERLWVPEGRSRALR